MKKIVISALLMVSSLLYSDTMYEDAEDGATTGWRVYDNTPAGAVINNINTFGSHGRVISFDGDHRHNGYILGANAGAEAWNSTDKNIRWSMNFNEDYTVYISVATTLGRRYITYTSRDYNKGKNGSYIGIGLGANSKNGTWQRFSRDLESDLKLFEPDNQILSVNAFLVRGSGMVDSIETTTAYIPEPTIHYYDIGGEVDKWRIYDDDPAGATITAEGGQTHLQGDHKHNGYILGAWSGNDAWNNTTESILKWDMSYGEDYTIYVAIITEDGWRYIIYTPRNDSRGKRGNSILIGIDPMSMYLNASITRDIEADLKKYEPNNSLTSIQAFLVRGSGYFSQIHTISDNLRDKVILHNLEHGQHGSAFIRNVEVDFYLDNHLAVVRCEPFGGVEFINFYRIHDNGTIGSFGTFGFTELDRSSHEYLEVEAYDNNTRLKTISTYSGGQVIRIYDVSNLDNIILISEEHIDW